MERRPSFKKRPNPQFKKGGGGGGNKRGRFGEQSLSSSPGTSETVYRILCPSRKIGSVLGKGGEIIKALREETQSKITVAESVPGSEERVVMVYSPSLKLPATNSDLELHCAAQDALLKVHDKIVAEDLIGGTHNADGSEIAVVTRLLVPNNTVGCIIGKKGDVITRLRSETGASIRVMPTDQLPACAMSTDELVQISAAPAVAKRALHVISTLLHQNPRKDKAPTIAGQGMFRPGPTNDNFPPANLMRSGRGSNGLGAPPLPWLSEYATEPPRFRHDSFNDFNDGPPAVTPGQDPPMDFSMKILCSSAKIGAVIGTAGSNVRQLQQETGTNIHVGDASADSDERVICVSSFEPLSNPRSRTIDAILLLQDKTSDYNEKGIVTTRILIPSSKVGCIIGQGGQVINEMRRRTKADIRVNSKEEKPRCAGEDEELVQVSGSYGVAKEVLGEIASRFRARCLRDGKPGADSGPGAGFVPRGNFPSGGPPSFGTLQGGHPGGFGSSKGGGRDYGPNSYPVPPTNYDPRSFPPPPRDYEPYGYPAPPPASGYAGAMDVNMPNSGRISGMGPGAHNVSEVPGTRLKPQDQYAAGAEPVAEMPGATHGVDVYQGYTGPGGQNHTLQPAYHNYGTQQGPFSDMNSSVHTSYHSTTTTTSTDPQHPPYPSQQGHYPETSYQYGQ
ncbi:K Homology domain-containing protein [Artemisia annua]|uniref:K Homology domain-containing protein n=1 Tax=Artemisia annua TaxID=35608 RepID=A0A2U1KC98_ARTAN|nr:K Homology domain-containing protein [Artemisia annua]